MSNQQEQVFDVLSKVSKKDRALIKPEHELAADLGIDSPKGLQLLMDLEETFKIEIEEDDAARMMTVKDVVSYVAGHA
jgi:acyl carrier protein